MEVVSKSEYDVIVVGTGPGGATVAREMARRGKKVLILEWGPGGEVRGTAAQYFSQAMIPGKSLLLTPDLVGMVRGITTGGSSLFYCGTAYPAPLEMLRKYGVDLDTEEQEMRAELPIAPLKAEMVTPMTSRLMASAQQIGLDWQMLDKFMYQDRWKPEYPGFGYYGDPHHVKWSARMYVEEAVAHGRGAVQRRQGDPGARRPACRHRRRVHDERPDPQRIRRPHRHRGGRHRLADHPSPERDPRGRLRLLLRPADQRLRHAEGCEPARQRDPRCRPACTCATRAT